MSLTILILLWFIYSFSEGVREGYANHQKSLSSFRRETSDVVVFFQRFLILLIFSYMIFDKGVWSYLLFLIGASSIFIYIQNGTYFLIRNKLNPGIFELIKDNEKPDMYVNKYWRIRLAYLGVLSQGFLWII